MYLELSYRGAYAWSKEPAIVLLFYARHGPAGFRDEDLTILLVTLERRTLSCLVELIDGGLRCAEGVMCGLCVSIYRDRWPVTVSTTRSRRRVAHRRDGATREVVKSMPD